MWRLPLAAWATVGALSIFLLGPRQGVEGLHHYFHVSRAPPSSPFLPLLSVCTWLQNYPHDSNFTVERAQYALERAGVQNTVCSHSACRWLSKNRRAAQSERATSNNPQTKIHTAALDLSLLLSTFSPNC